MRLVLPILLAGLSGCVTIGSTNQLRSPTSPAMVADDRVALAVGNGAAQTRTGQTVQRRGLPLTRGQKIALWSGVAVLLAALMADSDDEDASAFRGP